MKPTAEEKEVLRNELLEILTSTRGVFRPSELLRHICHDPRFIKFNCMHVGHQLRELKKERKVRQWAVKTGFSTYRHPRMASVYGFLRGWGVVDLSRREREYFQEFTWVKNGPVEVHEWELLK